MESRALISPEILAWIVIPLLIILVRICDVSLGTLRIIYIGRGDKLIAPLLGFLEVLIWLFAIRQIMQNLTNILYYLAYAGGFGAGTFLGMYIEQKLAFGRLAIRIITNKDASALIGFLRSSGYGVTSVDAHGASGPVHVIYTIINRRDIQEVTEIMKRFNPKSFYVIEDIRFASEGIFRAKNLYKRGYLNFLRGPRQGK
jgi:uncharacterized protein YebE (UPF0316 family)